MKEAIQSKNVPANIGPYSQAIKADDYLFASGQIAIDPRTGELAGQNIEQQTRQVMENVKQLLVVSGFDFNQVVKTTIFLTDMSYFKAVNKIYGEYFKNEPPARSCVAVNGLPKGALVEIEILARC